jgi:hypothetical protein
VALDIPTGKVTVTRKRLGIQSELGWNYQKDAAKCGHQPYWNHWNYQ